MSNLTYSQHIVKPLTPPVATGGCHLVVYREGRGGRWLYQVLPPGAPFRPRLLDRLGKFSGYAVSGSPTLRHRFSRQHHVGTGTERDSFTLKVVVRYRVTSPELVVAWLESDPLGTLEAAVADVLERRAAELTYGQLMNPDLDMESFVLQTGAHAPTSGATSAEEELEEAARDLGFELLGVGIVRIHSSGVIEDGGKIAEIGRDAQVAEAERLAGARVETVDLTIGEELRDARFRAKYHQQVEENRIQGLRAANAVLVAGVEGLSAALGNIGEETRTGRDLREAVRQVTAAQKEYVQLATAASGPAELTGGGALAAFPEAGASASPLPTSPLAAELYALVRALEGLDGSSGLRRELAGRVLHVIAESCLNGSAPDGRLDEYVESVAELVASSEIVNALAGTEEAGYFRRFCQIERARQELSALCDG